MQSRLLVAAAVVLVVAARAVAAAPTLTDTDAWRLLNLEPRPVTWAWPRQPSEVQPFKREPPPASAKYVGDGMKEWQDSAKLGHIDISLFPTAALAHAALPSYHAFARRWAKKESGSFFTDQSVAGLGDEAWRITQEGTMVTYGWRRANAVIEVHVQCIAACPSDPAAAARVWAGSVDRAARAAL